MNRLFRIFPPAPFPRISHNLSDQKTGRTAGGPQLIPRFRQHFDQLEVQLGCFCLYGVQMEGWFKGELLTLLHRLKAEQVISDFDREVRIGNKRVDFKVDIGEQTNWVELKYWLVGEQRGTAYRPRFYFNDRAVGIMRDVVALRDLPAAGQRWLLIMTGARTDREDWTAGVREHNVKFGHKLIPLTSPTDFPPSYFLGLLRVDA